VEEKIEEINGMLPEGVHIVPYYQQKDIVEASVKTTREQEMEKVKKSGRIADLSDTNVYVIGEGMIDKESYRDAKSLGLLTDFWEAYFLQTHANLRAIGTPMLLEDIQ